MQLGALCASGENVFPDVLGRDGQMMFVGECIGGTMTHFFPFTNHL